MVHPLFCPCTDCLREAAEVCQHGGLRTKCQICELEARVEELERDRRHLRQVLEDIHPFLNETECECSDEGTCCKHQVEIALANFPKQ